MKRLKNGLLFFIIISIYACAWLPHKKKILVPETGYKINQQTLKTNGYYYCEEPDRGICYCPYNKFEFADKRIKCLFLYEDGYAYYEVNYRTSGFNDLPLEKDSAFVVTHNTTEEAVKNFERELNKRTAGISSKSDKGIFHIYGDSLIIQSYTFDQGSFLNQFRGKILNDSTFVFNIREVYGGYLTRKPSSTKINNVFHFKEYPIKADSINYIRDHRQRFGK